MNYYKFAQDKGIKTTYDDFLFEQQSIRDSFKGIVNALGNSNNTFILSGCVQSGSIQVSDGWICIDGEILKHSLTLYPDLDTGIDGYYWDIEETFDPAGLKTTDLTTVDVQLRIIRRAICKPYIVGDITIPLPPNRIDISAAKTVTQIIRESVFTPILWIPFTTFNAAFSTDSAYPAEYGKDRFGFVHLRGRIKNITASFGGITASGSLLPSGYLPGDSNSIQTPITAKKDGNVYLRLLSINYTGQLAISSLNFGNAFEVNELLCLDGVNFFGN